ncbi:DUF4179 domain-containing protein [Paenibacillus naphthalenovorans]|uniref:DUF4179 domain-containing protein n=1 Tax=Paenibacillus naphthalenovorans TaxID=162209 RepID=UPI000888FBEC|nr:DUF4179 domain-containing protein [Paenibacillus naphthalenovorans]SDJ40209.1 protein of unknown function [Paenibacillus naphthalenovorans]
MKNELQFKSELQQSLSKVAVPDSLYRFAKEVPDIYERERETSVIKSRPNGRHKLNLFSILSKSAAAIAILTGTFSVGVSMSPAFAAYMKEVPGFDIAVDWLNHLRGQDGVQVAIENGYTPIEAKTAQFGGTTVTISDIYLTDEELLFKAFIHTNEYDVRDGRSNVHIEVAPINLRGGGSTTGTTIAETTDESKGPVLQVSYKFQLPENAAREFLAKEKELQFEVRKLILNREIKRADIEQMGMIAVPVDQNKLLHNKVYEPNQSLPNAVFDPDLKELILEKLTIKPTTMNAILYDKNGLTLDFPREEGMAPYLKDEKGNVYKYDPSGPALMLEDGKQQLPFSSSIFFEKDTAALQLHIGTVSVTEKDPSGTFELSKNDTFPKTVQFKKRLIVIEGAEFKNGYIHLKIKKEYPDQKILDGVRFYIPDYYAEMAKNKEIGRNLDALREEFKIEGWERAESSDIGLPYLDLYIPAPMLDSYTISLQRVNAKVAVNQDYLIKLK